MIHLHWAVGALQCAHLPSCEHAKLCCRYYTEQIHQAAFTLPKFAHEGLKDSLSSI